MVVRISVWRINFCWTAIEVPTASSQLRYVCRLCRIRHSGEGCAARGAWRFRLLWRLVDKRTTQCWKKWEHRHGNVLPYREREMFWASSNANSRVKSAPAWGSKVLRDLVCLSLAECGSSCAGCRCHSPGADILLPGACQWNTGS